MVSFNPNDGAQSFSRVYANQLSEGIRRAKYFLIDNCAMPPWTYLVTDATQVPALPAANQGEIDNVVFPNAPFGNHGIELFQTTAQTKFPARVAGKGIEIGLDGVNNESVEYVPGGNDALNPLGYTAGSDPGVFIRATLEFTDSSGSDQFIMGFRKQEAYAVPVSFLSTGDALYTDFCGIGFSGTAAANLVKTMQDLNNVGSTVVTSTAFAWADTKVHKLEMWIKGRVARFFINGVELGGTVSQDALGVAITAQATVKPAAFTFDSGDFLIPFIFSRFDATTPGTIILRRLEVGQLLEVGLQPEGRGPEATRL